MTLAINTSLSFGRKMFAFDFSYLNVPLLSFKKGEMALYVN